MDGIYRPPKLVPMYNDIDETAEDRERKQMERIKRKAFNSSVIKDLENEYSGAPEEIRVILKTVHFKITNLLITKKLRIIMLIFSTMKQEKKNIKKNTKKITSLESQ